MHLLTAPTPACAQETPRPWVFLAGGITNCPLWQEDAIHRLAGERGTLFNPRRENFPINDPNAAPAQIEWEFRRLNQADIFTIWFSNSPTDQPICFYELGRHLALSQMTRTEFGDHRPCVVGCERGWKRIIDVIEQTRLAMGPDFPIHITLGEYIEGVRQTIRAWHQKAYDAGE